LVNYPFLLGLFFFLALFYAGCTGLISEKTAEPREPIFIEEYCIIADELERPQCGYNSMDECIYFVIIHKYFGGCVYNRKEIHD